MATERRSHALSAYSSIHVYADETQVDVANNRSYVSTELWIKGSSYSAYNVDCNVTGGGGYTNSHLTANDWVKLVSGGFWAPHNADGTGSATVGSYYSSGYGNMPYGEFTLTLSNIPRASQPSINTWPNNSPDITAGLACTIHMNKHANFTHKVSYSFGKKSGVIATGVVDNCSWTPPTSLLDQISTATVGYGGISVETYSGSTKIGDTKTCNFNLHVPSDANPTVGTITLTEQHEGVKAKNGNVTVQQISKKLVSVPVTAKYSTSIKSVVCDGVTLTNTNGTYTGYVSNKSNGTYTVTATDNRGLKSTDTVKQTYYAYSKPYVTASLKRESETSQNGTLSASGTYSTILSNTVSMSIKRNDESSATSVTPTLSNGNISFRKAYTDLYYTLSFSIAVTVTDSFGESMSATAYLGVGQYAFAMIKQGVVLGPDSYLFDKQNAIRSVLDFFYPVGSIYISTSSTFNPQTAWGGTWKKTADGRCLIGASDKYPLRSTGGEAEHTLTVNEMPTHRHYSSRVNWYNDLQTNGISVNIAAKSNLKVDGPYNYTDYAGNSKAHNNMQPYLAVYIWERTA
ncbi:DUF859 family phage minor structural protein [Bulleidia sp. HCP3S3_F2]|uniref:DUF859 family phage minor structural protein n=1 Tax=unclassified Bulleidia TaxID=2704656 RepID=UPI003F898CCF